MNDFSVPEDYLYAHGVFREQRRARTCIFVRDQGTYRVRVIELSYTAKSYILVHWMLRYCYKMISLL